MTTTINRTVVVDGAEIPNTVEVRLTWTEAVERGIRREGDVSFVAEGVEVGRVVGGVDGQEWRTVYSVNAADAARFGIRG